MLNLKQVSLSVLLLFCGITLSYAQSGQGQIEGTVTDASTGEVLPGVNITIEGTSIGAASDLDGNYVIRRVPSGRHVLVFSYIGYERLEMPVEVIAGRTVEVDAGLTWETIEGEEIVITVQREGQQQAINQQLNSDKIVSVVSEARIQELPDFNAAAALARLPGVSTTKSSGEDNKVVIRGLAPKYNSIEVEGVRLSATGSPSIGVTSDVFVNTNGVNTDRSVDLTSISPYMIRMISVFKSLTPDMNANSIGGTVNMELREAPSNPHFDFLWQQGYTAKSNTYGNYRAVLSGSNRFFKDRFGAYLLANLESYDRNADNMNANYGLPSNDVTIDPETGFRPVRVNQVTFNRHIEGRDRYGANLILDYRLPSGSLKFVNMYARINSDYTDFNQSIGYNDGRMNWRMQQAENTIDQRMHSLKLDYDLDWVNVDLSASYTASHNLLDDSPVLNFNQTSAVKIGGPEVFNRRPEDMLEYQEQFQGVDRIILRSANLFTSDYNEDRLSYKADFEFPFGIGTTVNGSFKVGGQYFHQSNSLDQEAPYMAFDGNAASNDMGIANNMMRDLMQTFDLEISPEGWFTGPSFVNSDADLFDPFLDDQFGSIYFIPQPERLIDMVNYVIGNPLYDASNREQSTGRQGGWYDGPFQQFTNDYSFDEDYYATYAMAQFTLGPIFAIGGVRYEKVSSDYVAYNARDIRNAQTQFMVDTTAASGNEFLLPMGQVKYSPLSWLDIRYAYTQTLARPDYHHLSPKFTISNDGNTIWTGNSDLKPARAYNHDVNLSFYGNKLGLLSVGAFYKKIENFVFDASYVLQGAMDTGFDDVANYQITCTPGLRDRLGSQYEELANCADGALLVSPPRVQLGYLTTVNRPMNNPYDATVKGLEFDFQHSFWYLPAPLSNVVVGTNYTRIFSDYKQPIYAWDTRFEGRTPVLVFTDSTFSGRLIDQPNHVLNSYLGYDYKGFSVRFSLLYQSNTATSSGRLQPENDSFTDDYLRLDVSARQKIPFGRFNGEVFMDVTNLNGAENRSLQRSIGGFQNIQNYGLTANLGVRLRY